MGRMTSISKNYSSNNTVNENYNYNLNSELISVSHFDGEIEHFTYDNKGNITSREVTKDNLSTFYSYIYDNSSRLSSVRNIDLGSIIYNITYNNQNILYPSSITKNNNTYNLTFNGKRLVSINNNIEYKYNDEGLRIYKEIDNDSYKYHYDKDRLISIEIYNSNNYINTIYFNYDNNGLIHSITYNDKTYIYLRDILLNILGIIDENGNYIVRYKYSAYGKVTKDIESNLSNDSTFVANFNPLIYKGYYYDIETGFYYLESRYYDPEIGRFISPDSVDYLDPTSISGLNLYSYANNNPISIHYNTTLASAGIVGGAIAKLPFTGLYAGSQFGLKQLIGYGINQIWRG